MLYSPPDCLSKEHEKEVNLMKPLYEYVLLTGNTSSRIKYFKESNNNSSIERKLNLAMDENGIWAKHLLTTPSLIAYEKAKLVGAIFEALQLNPEKITPTKERGFIYEFISNHSDYIVIEIDEDGDIAFLKEVVGSSPVVQVVSIDQIEDMLFEYGRSAY